MSLPRRLGHVIVAAVLAAGFAVLPGVAATAAGGCDAEHGVVVIVDFGGLDHADVHRCVSDGGGHDAATLLGEVGLSLTDVQRQPGFVCRVDGLPSDDPCVNTPPSDAYWALWWSDGAPRTWTYSTVMASALEVPAGGYVALVWHEGTVERPPSTDLLTGGAGAGPTTAAGSGGSARADRPAASGRDGLPTWTAPVAIVLLFGVAAAVAVLRRRVAT